MSNAVWQYTESGRLSTVLVQATKDIPEPDDDGVVVKTKAMALNPVDEQM
jgi:NADPH:quinone reductase-like Zn-dependent oxidoreductase